jgi:Zn-dependent protease with chaperone function
VSIAACLFLYGLAAAVFAPPVLWRLTRAGHAPRLCVSTWLATIASVLVSWTFATVLLFTGVARAWNHPGSLVTSCLATIHTIATGRTGGGPQFVLAALVAVVVALVGVGVVRLVRLLTRMRNDTLAHAQSARMVGRRVPELDAVVIEADWPAAYCVAGRPDTIVVTSAALRALRPRELDAVLAHERAHLAGHHHQIIAVVRGLATAFPRLALVTGGAREVPRLLEMCADDAAARRHGTGPLLDGLIALASGGPTPTGSLAASAVDVLDRAHRLAAGATSHRAAVQTALITGITLAAASPIVVAYLATAGAPLCAM